MPHLVGVFTVHLALKVFAVEKGTQIYSLHLSNSNP